MESAIRLRLLFDNRYLSISQKTEGLKRSWLLLKPEFETIFDLESYLVHAFDLGDACPNGLLFSMDGFVVPPFESTQIFKDKDIIRVKRRACTLEDVVRICDEVSSPEDSGIVEKRLVPSGAKLLALEEIENESGGYQSELEENSSDEHDVELSLESPPGRKTTSKKRKSSHKLQSAKRKKIKSSTNDGNDVVTELNQGCHSNGVLSKKKSHKKDKSSKKKGNLIILSTIEVGDRDTNIAQPVPSELRYNQHRNNGKEDREASPIPEGGIEKIPSRSARRKKAKRKWLREQLANAQKNEVVQSNKTEKVTQKKSQKHQSSEEDDEIETEVVPVHRKSPERQPSDEDDEMDSEIVPRVVRPGHIRFEPLNEDDALQRSQDPVDNFQWNGTTSKKRGQKWGQEKASTSRSNNYNDYKEGSVEKITIEEGQFVDPVDFEKLKPLSCLPKEGDVVAYRLVELSSSWCPELSSFRIGKVMWYETTSKRIMLVSVPGYPVFTDEKGDDDEEAEPESDVSLYKEDGSLEIDFASLVDVRIFSHDSSDLGIVVPGCSSAEARTTKIYGSCLKPNGNSEEPNAPIIESGIWNEVSKVLNEKKMQLLQKDGWTQKESSVKSPWPFRALRSSALGPTMALLRSGNDLSV